jgi:hypothetical protein
MKCVDRFSASSVTGQYCPGNVSKKIHNLSAS